MSRLSELARKQFVVPWQEFWKILRHNYAKDNGYFPRIRGLIINTLRINDLKHGTLVGKDEYGNRYFENNRYFVGRNRWVDYNQETFKDKWEFNASQVPSEWHRWLHYMTDDPPTIVPPKPRPFTLKHTRNLTGTRDCFVPYTTTRPKIESWKPPQ